MRRKIWVVLVTVTMMSVLASCCISHDWQEATCTEAKMCAKCGEVEGEALGHIWQEATCSVPKNCSTCGVTEGEKLAHVLTEPNYQQPAICEVCGETVGDPLEPVAVAEGIVCSGELNVVYPYIAPCRDSTEHTTNAQVEYIDYTVFEGDDTHERMDEYEWRAVTIKLTFTADENALLYGYSSTLAAGDYYTDDLDESYDGNLFTVNYYGEYYTDCTLGIEDISFEESEDGLMHTYTKRAYFRVPIGYDGIYIVYHNPNLSDEEDTEIVYFRMNK